MTGKADLFTTVHKGLRTMIYNLSSRLQTNDFADVAMTTALAIDLENDFAVARSAGCILCALGNHAEHEEKVVFPGAAKFDNGLVTSLIAEHHDLTRRELEIGKAAHELLSLPNPDERIAAGVRLNRMANELFAAYITHMNKEEAQMVPLMREHFTDAEQGAMQGAIIGAFPPDRLMALLGWMLPSLNVSELSGLVSTLKMGAPRLYSRRSLTYARQRSTLADGPPSRAESASNPTASASARRAPHAEAAPPPVRGVPRCARPGTESRLLQQRRGP